MSFKPLILNFERSNKKNQDTPKHGILSGENQGDRKIGKQQE